MGMHGNWMMYRSLTSDRSVKNQRLAEGTRGRVFGYARKYKRVISIYLVVLVISAVLVVAQPLLFRYIVDHGIQVKNSKVVVVCALLIAGLAVVDNALGLVGRWLSSRIGEGLIFDLRTQVFEHVQTQPIAFFTRAQTGALVSRLNSDVVGAQQAFTSTLGGVVGNLISLIITVATMAVLSWKITLAALLLLPVFLLPARVLGRKLAALSREQMNLNADLSNQMTERFNVSGALLVKLFGRPKDEIDYFSSRAARVRDIGISIAVANRFFFSALTLVASLATAIAYGFGGLSVINNEFTFGTLLALVGLLAQLYGPLTALSNVRVDIMTALVSFERVFEVLDLPPLVKDAPGAMALPHGPTAVEFKNVHFRYPTAAEVSLASLESVARAESIAGGQSVLNGVDFSAPAGSLVALVGPSGAGKTTITSLVSRLYDVSDGSVIVGGHDVRELTQESLHSVIGVVTQDAHMFHDTIRNNLLYARPDASDEDLRKACIDAQIWDLIERLPDGLDTVVGDRGHRLSGGEKQRMAIARLLLKAPNVVVLDEATAHLDSESEAAVQRALAQALKGRTSLVIAHRLSTIRDASQILVIDGGQVAERGTHEELLAKGGLYASLYETQFADQASQTI
ncbi:MAG: ABC transporter ATP-binding protein [Actinobacteria bacterium]|nr:ABC transporter ATP-binding protein [Actinomycetota bacterium]